MAFDDRETRLRVVDVRSRPAPAREPPVGELFKDLANDTSRLVRQEMALAKAEMREMGRALARDAMYLGAAISLVVLGALALTAFLIAGLGEWMGDAYWLSALLVGVVFTVVGAIWAKREAKALTRDAVPDDTIASLRRDAQWAKHEARELKRELSS